MQKKVEPLQKSVLYAKYYMQYYILDIAYILSHCMHSVPFCALKFPINS